MEESTLVTLLRQDGQDCWNSFDSQFPDETEESDPPVAEKNEKIYNYQTGFTGFVGFICFSSFRMKLRKCSPPVAWKSDQEKHKKI